MLEIMKFFIICTHLALNYEHNIIEYFYLNYN